MGLTKYYIDAEGNYLGGYSEGNPAIPGGAIEVSAPPEDGRQKYISGAWQAITSRVIPSISTRQFLIAAAMGGIITEQEAIDAATSGAVPSAIDAVFGSLPSDQAFAAHVTWAKMTVIERSEPLVIAAAAAFGMTES